MSVIQWWVIKALEKEYPNDQEFGGKVREYLHKVKEAKNGKDQEK